MKLIFRILRKLFGLLVWLAILLGALFVLFLLTGEALLKPVVQQELERITGGAVEIESLNIRADGYFELVGISLGPAGDDIFNTPLFEADRVTTDVSIWSLLKGKPRVNRLTVRDFVVNVSYDIDSNRLNWEGLKAPKLSGELAVRAISFVGGAVRIDKYSGGDRDEIAVIPVTDVSIVAGEEAKTYDISIESGKDGDAGYSIAQGQIVIAEKINIKLGGELSTSGIAPFGNKWDMQDVSVEAEFDGTGLYVKWCEFTIDDTNASLTAELTGFGDELEYKLAITASDVLAAVADAEQKLVYGEGMADMIGGGLKRFVDNYTPEGVFDADIELSGKVGKIGGSLFVGRLNCKDVTIIYSGFPYRLDKLNGTLDIVGTDVDLRQLKCRHGDVEFVIDGRSTGRGADNEYEIIITSENMVLDEDLYAALSDDQKQRWNAFGPSGRVKVVQRLKCGAGEVFDNELKIQLDGVDAVYEDFAYPLKGLTGQVVIAEDGIELIDIVSEPNGVEGLRIAINGKVTRTGTDESIFKIGIDATNLAVDDTLMSAMSAEQRSFYGNFEVDGFVDANMVVSSSAQGSEEMDIVVDLGIDGADVKCGNIPVTLENVNLKAKIIGDTVVLHQMAGEVFGGSFNVSGKILGSSEGEDKIVVDVAVECENIDVDEEWLSFLPGEKDGEPNAAAYDANISMTAKCKVELSGSDFKVISTRLNCSDGRVDFKGSDFVLDRIRGDLVITEDGMEFDKFNVLLKGKDIADGGYDLVIAGRISFAEQEIFKNDISVTVDEIAMENIPAVGMSDKLVSVYESLKPRGRINMSLDNITVHSGGEAGRWIEFDSDLEFDGFGLGDQGDITDAEGWLTGRWRYNIGSGISGGEGSITCERMKLRGHRLSDFTTDYKYDGVEGRFGLEKFSADCYGGRIAGDLDCEPMESGGTGYVLQTKFDGIDIGELFEDRSEEKVDWQGKVFGRIGLDGEFGDQGSRIGRLKINVTDMKFARRSFFDKVLAVISMTNPADHMFNEITLDAYIKRNIVVFEKVRMIGDLNVFQGSGSVDLDSEQVRIELTAFGKDLTEDPSLLESLARGIGGAVVKVEVGGSLSEPDVVVTPLPVVMWPLELLGMDKKSRTK